MPQVKDLMHTDVITVGPNDTTDRALSLMVKHKISGLPVVDDEKTLVGVISRHDLVRSIRNAARQPVAKAPIQLNGRVLLVEDGRANARLSLMVLKKAGAEVTLVENGRDAVDRVAEAEDPFDVILMDMQMPVMDGYAATRELRSRGYSTPIVALTAHAMKGDRQKCLDAGCDDYIAKPINRDKLLDLISRSAEKPLRAVGAPAPDA